MGILKMATISQSFVLIFSCYFIRNCASFGLFDAFGTDTDSCEDICLNTYPLHTYENKDYPGFCQRGCRFFSIIDSISFGCKNHTIKECYSACSDAHPDADDDATACSLGCDCQAKASEKMRKQFKQVMSEDDPLSPVFPFLYAHDIFSNMFDKMTSQFSVRSWSLYTSNEDGQLVVIQSQPDIYINEEIVNMPDDDDYKTSNYLESNLMAVDNSATPNIRHSQIQRLYGRDMDLDEMNYATQQENSDWLGCIAYKTGLPRLLLSCTIFLSAVVMIWLCLTTAATAPEQRVKSEVAPPMPEKLSIYGDLDQLALVMDEKMILSQVNPVTLAGLSDLDSQAEALPIKVLQVHKI